MSKYIKLEDAIGYECPLNEIWEDCIKCPLNNSAVELCKMGKWLNSLPTFEVSEDCIGRKWLEKNFQTVCENVRCNECPFDSDDCRLIEFIIDAPSVVPTGRKNRQVERAEGEWVRTFDGNEWYWYCSNCKEQWYEDDLYMGGNEFPHYCPNCGAKMKGADDDI